MGFFSKIFESKEDNFKRVGQQFKEVRNMDLLVNITVKELEGIELKSPFEDYNTINLFHDRMRFCGFDSKVDNDTDNTRNVFRKDITGIRIMDTRQIEEQSKVGQMMIIGVLALGTKKRTTTTLQRRIVVDICEEGINFSIIFDALDKRYPILDMAKRLNKWYNTGTWE